MGKVKSWLMDMEEDAMWMSRDSWAGRHGSHNLDVFDKARDKYEGHIVEPDGPITCRPFSGSLKKEGDDES